MAKKNKTVSKSKRVNKIIPIGIYPFDLMISFNESDKQIKKILKNYNIKKGEYNRCKVFNLDHIKTLSGRTIMFHGNQTLIRLNFIPQYKDSYKMSILQHEIFHVVEFIMAEIDTPLNGDTREPYAYLIQYLTEQIYKEL